MHQIGALKMGSLVAWQNAVPMAAAVLSERLRFMAIFPLVVGI